MQPYWTLHQPLDWQLDTDTPVALKDMAPRMLAEDCGALRTFSQSPVDTPCTFQGPLVGGQAA